MEDTTIFIIGSLITLMLSGTVGLLLLAAVEDGKSAREAKARQAGHTVADSNSPKNVS